MVTLAAAASMLARSHLVLSLVRTSVPALSTNQDHGQLYSARTVKAVSTLFENVLVDTNHCQGLTAVR